MGSFAVGKTSTFSAKVGCPEAESPTVSIGYGVIAIRPRAIEVSKSIDLIRFKCLDCF